MVPMISCGNLWNNWKKNFPEAKLVQEISERIKSHSREDWDKMIEEAHLLNQSLGELIKDNVPISDKRAEKAFDDIRDHYEKWFCSFTQAYVDRIAPTVTLDPDFHQFFDQQAEGLAKYMPKLMRHYSYKLPKE